MEILPIQSNPIQSNPIRIHFGSRENTKEFECSPLSQNGWGWGGVGGQWGPLGPELWGKAGLQGPAWVPPAVAGRVTSSRVPCPTRGHSRGRFASGRITDTPARQDQAAAFSYHPVGDGGSHEGTNISSATFNRHGVPCRRASAIEKYKRVQQEPVCISRRGGNHELRTRLVQHGRSQVRPQSCPPGRRCHPSPAPRKY